MNHNISRLFVSTRRIVSSHFFSQKTRIDLKNAIISFSFDDVPKVTYDFGLPIFYKYGLTGTFYISGSLCNGRPDFLDPGQIQTLLDEGHDVGCHTFGHLQTGRCLPRTLERDLKKNQEYFQKNYSNFRPTNFAYPSGSIGIWNKPLMSKIFTSLRSNCPGINHGTIDLTTLLANKLYQRKTSFNQIDHLIRLASEKRGWLIFYTHDVSHSPSEFGCSPEILSYSMKAAKDSGACVLNIKDALSEMSLYSRENYHRI